MKQSSSKNAPTLWRIIEQFFIISSSVTARAVPVAHISVNLKPSPHCEPLDSAAPFWNPPRLMQQAIVTLDMEGVLTPEIWIAVAEKTGISELRRTTRDEPDYDKLMRYRIGILDRHGIKLSDIQAVIGSLTLLDGAKAFLDELLTLTQVIILSATFAQFA